MHGLLACMAFLFFNKEKVAVESRRVEYLTAAGGRQTFSADHLHLCSRQPEMMTVIEVDCEKWTTFDSPYGAQMDAAKKEGKEKQLELLTSRALSWHSAPSSLFLDLRLLLLAP